MEPIRSYCSISVGLPRIQAGRLLHYPFRGLLSVHSRYGLHARRVAIATLLHRRLQRLRYLHRCFDCYRAERTSSRAGLAPAVDQRLFTAHSNLWLTSVIVKYTTRFQRDYRREKSGRHSKKLDALLMEVVNLLAADTPLPRRNFDHPLSGEWNDHRDCHIRPDLVLIYRKPDDDSLELVRLGSHSELGL